MKKLIALIVLSFAFALPAHADAPVVKPAELSAKDKVQLAAITDYLNKLKNLNADFLQVDESGGMMRGTIQISRPGKMHVSYDPPDKDFIIADGSYVHIWDDQLQSQTNVEQGSSLAEFILRDPIQLNGDVTVTKFNYFPAKEEVTLVQTNDPGAGSLTLVFETKPLKLRQWKVVDAENRMTGVTLENVTEGMTFPDNTFDFVPPNLGKSYSNKGN